MKEIDLAIQFLNIIFPKELRDLGNIILKDFGRIGTAYLYLALGDLERALDENRKNMSALAFGTAVRNKGFKTANKSQGGKKDCSAIQALKLDFDSIENGGAKSPLSEENKKIIAQAVKNGPLKPSIIVDSGGGIHAYYRLDKPFQLKNPDDVSRFERLNAKVISHFTELKLPCIVDPAIKDVSRLMRLPGSYNFKYGEAKMVKIMEVFE